MTAHFHPALKWADASSCEASAPYSSSHHSGAYDIHDRYRRTGSSRNGSSPFPGFVRVVSGTGVIEPVTGKPFVNANKVWRRICVIPTAKTPGVAFCSHRRRSRLPDEAKGIRCSPGQPFHSGAASWAIHSPLTVACYHLVYHPGGLGRLSWAGRPAMLFPPSPATGGCGSRRGCHEFCIA